MQVKPGDVAEVIKSVDGAAIGMTVTVVSFQGHHSQYGPIWRCQSTDTIVTEFGGFGNEADFADDWLRKIEDPSTLIDTTKELELHH